jgi:hypothetical protein
MTLWQYLVVVVAALVVFDLFVVGLVYVASRRSANDDQANDVISA